MLWPALITSYRASNFKRDLPLSTFLTGLGDLTCQNLEGLEGGHYNWHRASTLTLFGCFYSGGVRDGGEQGHERGRAGAWEGTKCMCDGANRYRLAVSRLTRVLHFLL